MLAKRCTQAVQSYALRSIAHDHVLIRTVEPRRVNTCMDVSLSASMSAAQMNAGPCLLLLSENYDEPHPP